MIGQLRDLLGRQLRSMLAGTDRPAQPAPDSLFGPGSAMWLVHGDVATLVGGLRSLLLQTLHPLAMAGVADHSDYRHDPLGRLHRTAAFVGTTTFGSEADIDATVARIRAIHEHVVGTAPDNRPYSANDPHLLGWVHCTEVDSFLKARIRYGAQPLPAGTANRYVAQMGVIGSKLGVDTPPTTTAQLKTRLEAYRRELAVNHQAREAIRFLTWPPLPIAARGPYGLLLAASIGLLPGFARRMLWLPMLPLVEPVAVRPAATVLLRTIGWALASHPEPAAAAP